MRKRLRMEPINRRWLMGYLFGSEHIGPTGWYFNVPMKDYDGNIIFRSDVYVYPVNSGRRHRVHVRCPICRCFHPFGRMHQHINTQACDHACDVYTSHEWPMEQNI